jgi:hypothetical protein
VDTFEFISVALSFVIGLGVTHLLSAFVRVFLNRKRMRVDWIPMAWAFSIFASMIQYWWAVFELASLEVWPIGHFLAFLGMALLLFVAGALVLPAALFGEAEDLGDIFEEHGRWGLVVLSAYTMTVLVGNAVFWGSSPFSAVGLRTMILAGLPLGVVIARGRTVRGLITVSYLGLWVIAAWQASPAAY